MSFVGWRMHFGTRVVGWLVSWEGGMLFGMSGLLYLNE